MEDIVFGKEYHQTSVKVMSQTAKIFTLSKEEFCTLQKTNIVAWKAIVNSAGTKI